jgi:hypothetical protein
MAAKAEQLPATYTSELQNTPVVPKLQTIAGKFEIFEPAVYPLQKATTTHPSRAGTHSQLHIHSSNKPKLSPRPVSWCPPLIPSTRGAIRLPSAKGLEKKKPFLACLFCRQRKIACKQLPFNSKDGTCRSVSSRRSICSPAR